MPTVLEEFRRRYALLSNMAFDEDQARVAGFLEWLEREPLTVGILNRLRSDIQVEGLLEPCKSRNPPRVSSPEEQARVGIFLMERCREGTGLWHLSHEYEIRPRYSTNKLQEYSDAVFERYIEPTCDYIENMLYDQLEEESIEDIALIKVSSIFSPSFINTFPKTIALLNPVKKTFLELNETVNWFNVGTECRQALISFSDEISEVTGADIPNGTKKGDVKTILKQIIKETSDFARYEETLCNLVDSLWAHVNVLLHRETSNREDASRVYLWTALLITEVFEILKRADVES